MSTVRHISYFVVRTAVAYFRGRGLRVDDNMANCGCITVRGRRSACSLLFSTNDVYMTILPTPARDQSETRFNFADPDWLDAVVYSLSTVDATLCRSCHC
jgi:hypothetical protein